MMKLQTATSNSSHLETKNLKHKMSYRQFMRFFLIPSAGKKIITQQTYKADVSEAEKLLSINIVLGMKSHPITM